MAEESLNTFKGDQKKLIDRSFVIWCCKSSRPLSLGENDKAFRRFCLVATQGKYKPPCVKTAKDELTTCVAASRQLVKAKIHDVIHKDRLDLCLSGRS